MTIGSFPMSRLFSLCTFLIIILVLNICLVRGQEGATSSNSNKSDCPVCIRVLKAARDLTKQDKSGTQSVSEALTKYCQLQNIPVEDQQFCYNIDTMHKDLSRLITLGASDDRICKRVKSANPHFCSTKTTSSTKTDSMAKKISNSAKKGIIYI